MFFYFHEHNPKNLNILGTINLMLVPKSKTICSSQQSETFPYQTMVGMGKFHRFIRRNNIKLILNLKIVVCRSVHEILNLENAFSDRAAFFIFVLPSELHNAMEEKGKQHALNYEQVSFSMVFSH